MEDKSKSDLEHVTYQLPSLVQKTYVPTQHVINLLPIGSTPIQPIQPAHVYIFLLKCVVYAQHESFKQIAFFFEQTTLVA
jgi:hypothetical protein